MRGLNHAVLGWPRNVKRAVVASFDAVLCLTATWVAFALRFDTLHLPQGGQWWVYGLAPLLAVMVFDRMGLYKTIFRYAGLTAIKTIAKAVAVHSLVLISLLVSLQALGLEAIPRSLGISQPLIFLLLVVLSRGMAKSWLVRGTRKGNSQVKKLLIYGAGAAGVQTAAALGDSAEFLLCGFVDDDPIKAGRNINGFPVHHPVRVRDVVVREQITDILLALPSAPKDRRGAIVNELRTVPVHVRTLPGLSDLANGRVTLQDFRELDIEDLLGRDPVPPIHDLVAGSLNDKTVMVTGAGGSIGSELCRQIVQEHPKHLVLLDHSEFALYRIDQDLKQLIHQKRLTCSVTALLGNVTDLGQVRSWYLRYQPDTVYHAAAYKHVPIVEANPLEGLKNNVIGTWHVAQEAVNQGIRQVVLVSTDKAVRPTNVMGASKRLAEIVLQALSAKETMTSARRTALTMVRFGNVLGSSGSVVPLFRQQIAGGGPVTVTHEAVTRFFMTISEAAQLVLQAGAMAQGGEVYVLDMGAPVKVMDMAKQMVTLSGLTVRDSDNPGGDIEIVVTGLRPGEKLYEELLTGNDPQPTAHPRIMQAREGFVPWSDLEPFLNKLKQFLEDRNVPAALGLLQMLVPEATLSAPPPKPNVSP